MRIKGRRVLITGASSGIGLALSYALARKGAVLVLASRRFDRLREVANKIGSAFSHIPIPLVIPCDVTDREAVSRLIKSCVDHFGGIDVLINNAGIGVYGNIERTALEDFRSVMEVNFFGTLYCMLEILPYLKRQGRGLIVNIASVAAQYGVPYLGAHSASKSALVALSQSLRAELSKSGISIMIVYPGYTQTDFFKSEKKVGDAHRPLGPYTPAQRVAEAIVRAIEKEKRDLVLCLEGKALTLSKSLLPQLVEWAMKRIADKLRDKKEGFDG